MNYMKRLICGILILSVLLLVGCSGEETFDPNAARITAADVTGQYTAMSLDSVEALYNRLSVPAAEGEVAMTLSGSDSLKYTLADGTAGDCTIKVESVLLNGTEEWVHSGNYLVNGPTLMSNMVGQRPSETKNDFSFTANLNGEKFSVALTNDGECTVIGSGYELNGTYELDGAIVVLTLTEGSVADAPQEEASQPAEESVEGEVVDEAVISGQAVCALYFYEANVYTNVMKLIPEEKE